MFASCPSRVLRRTLTASLTVNMTASEGRESPVTPQTQSTSAPPTNDLLINNNSSSHNNNPSNHTSISRATPPDTFSSPLNDSSSFCDDSTLASTAVPIDYQFTVIGTPQDFAKTSSNKSGHDSAVYDRLYADAQRKQPPSRIPQPKASPRNSRSVQSLSASVGRAEAATPSSATTTTPRKPKESVFERLYRK